MFIQRVRVRFQKKGELKAISHLDLMRAFERALRRTALPLRMSEGFNPRPRISFPAPLGVGIEGTDEAMEFELADWVYPAEVERKLREQLPEGLDLVSLELGAPHGAARAAEVVYQIAPRPALEDDARIEGAALDRFMAREEIPVERLRKGRQKTVNIRPFILALERKAESVSLRLKAGPEGSAHPEEILGALGFDGETCRAGFRVTRTRVQLAD